MLKTLRLLLQPHPQAVSRLAARSVATRLFSSSAAPNVLVLAEHNNTSLAPSTRSAITAAKALGGSGVTVAVVGSQCASVADSASKLDGVRSVLLVDDQTQLHPISESLVPIFQSIQQAHNFTHILAPSSSTSKSALPRLAAKLDVAPISDIIGVKSPDTFVRPIYAGNALATVRSKDALKIITVRPTSFEKTGDGSTTAPITSFSIQPTTSTTKWEGAELTKSERPELTAASIVVSGGRGLKSAENFKMLDELASLLNAAVGASRAAVDAGYAPNDMQVGQTGKVVAPDLYIAIGISGAIQHLAGMKDSKVIVAINKDAEAPIFQVSDYGLVADLFQVVPEMTQALKAK